MTPTGWGNATIGTLATLMVDVYKKLADQVAKDVEEAIREEREACAQVAENLACHYRNDCAIQPFSNGGMRASEQITLSIRARQNS